jgi:general secretion pathway protein G
MVVVVIIGILATIAAVNIFKQPDKANRKAALAQLRVLDVALDLFALDMGDYPDKLDELVNAPSNNKNWDGPYLKNYEYIPDDPWGNKYQYQYEKGSKGYSLFSIGKDGQTNTDDDIKPGKKSNRV